MILLLLSSGCAPWFYDARSYDCDPADDSVQFVANGPIELRDAGADPEICALHATSDTFPKRDGSAFTEITAVELVGLNSYEVTWEPNEMAVGGTLITIDGVLDREQGFTEVVRVTAPRTGYGTLTWSAEPNVLILDCLDCNVEIHGVAEVQLTLDGPLAFATVCSAGAGSLTVRQGLALIDDSGMFELDLTGPDDLVTTTSTSPQRPLACLR